MMVVRQYAFQAFSRPGREIARMSGPLRPPPGGKAAPQLYTIAHVDLAFSAVPARPAFAALDTIIIDSTGFNCAFLSQGRCAPRSVDSQNGPKDIAMTFKALL